MSQTSNQQIISPLILEQIQKAKNTITKINKEQCLQLENLFQAFKTRLITEIDKQQDKTSTRRLRKSKSTTDNTRQQTLCKYMKKNESNN